MSRYVANVVTRRLTVSQRRVTVHSASCRYARLRMRRYPVSTAEVLRLHARKLRGDNGVVKFCKICSPDWTATREEDAT